VWHGKLNGKTDTSILASHGSNGSMLRVMQTSKWLELVLRLDLFWQVKSCGWYQLATSAACMLDLLLLLLLLLLLCMQGDQVFFHRTLEKWNDVRSMPPIMDAVTGPVPNW
jgi:hypothetical protein